MQSYCLRIDKYKIIAVQHLKNIVSICSWNAIRVKCMCLIANSGLPCCQSEIQSNKDSKLGKWYLHFVRFDELFDKVLEFSKENMVSL